jgi:CheY-like chemotaxis protein
LWTNMDKLPQGDLMSGAGGYALLVEDDPDVGALLRHHLEALGWEVVLVTNAEDALGQIAAASPAVAIVDILLPGRDGRAVIRELKSAPTHRGCHVVAASIIDADDLAVEVDAVLAKPFARKDVVVALQRAGARSGGEVA